MAQKHWLQQHSPSTGHGHESQGSRRRFSAARSGVLTASPSLARCQETMHLLHSTLLQKLMSPTPSTTQIELAAQHVLHGAQETAAFIRLDLDQGDEAPFCFHSSDAEYHTHIAMVLQAVPARQGAAWGQHGQVSEAALQNIMDAYSQLAVIGLETHVQLGHVEGLVLGLVKATEHGGEGLRSSALFLLSQVALAGPEMAARIALLPNLPGACYRTVAADTLEARPSREKPALLRWP